MCVCQAARAAGFVPTCCPNLLNHCNPVILILILILIFYPHIDPYALHDYHGLDGQHSHLDIFITGVQLQCLHVSQLTSITFHSMLSTGLLKR